VADDPVLLITGASSGIGAATARAAAPRYRLVLAARREEPLRELVEELGGAQRALAVRCDVSEWEEVEAMAAAALDGFGRIDAVFANAGFGATRGFLEESVEHWRAMVLTNVYGVALTIRATLPTCSSAAMGISSSPARSPDVAPCPARSTRRRSGRRRRSARPCAPSCARCTTTTGSASP
jgi:NADP-dependent 3-hydroxy acid dehydrogenase YdfG